MLCKLLTCTHPATERHVVPYGTVNLCAGHAGDIEAWQASDFDRGIPTLSELMFACRFGPVDDPPLSDSARGPEYAHHYKTGTE